MAKKINNSELISTELLGEFFFKHSNKSNQDIIVSGYPNTKEQFLKLRSVVNQLNYYWIAIWYFKIENYEEYMSLHFKDKVNSKLVDKYGLEELISAHRNKSELRQELINFFFDSSKNSNNTFVNLKHQEKFNLDKYLKDKIMSQL